MPEENIRSLGEKSLWESWGAPSSHCPELQLPGQAEVGLLFLSSQATPTPDPAFWDHRTERMVERASEQWGGREDMLSQHLSYPRVPCGVAYPDDFENLVCQKF